MILDDVVKKANSNIPWQERAKLILEYHESQLKTHGISENNAKVSWTIRDTSQVFKLSPATIVHELRLARTLRDTPERLAGAASRQQALNLCDEIKSIRVELRNARRPLTATVLNIVKVNGIDYFHLKLDKTIQVPALDIDTLFLPRYHVRQIKE